MSGSYEIIEYKQGLSASIFMHNVGSYNLHYHKEMEFLFVVSGEIELVCEGQRYFLKQDDVRLINSGEMHSTHGLKDNIVIAIQINPDFCKKYYPSLQETKFIWPDYADMDACGDFLLQLKIIISRIVDEYRRGRPGYQLAIEGFINSLLSLIVRNIPQQKAENEIALHASENPNTARIIRISDYIKEHYMEEIQLQDVAKREFINASYLSRIFKETVGMSFIEYLNTIRLQKAIEMLLNTNMRIHDIAMQCGYSNIKSFNNLFKKTYTITPSEYRKMNHLTINGLETLDYLEFNHIQAFTHLEKYLNVSILNNPVQVLPEEFTIIVDTDAVIGRLFKDWRNIAAVGRAYDILRADMQEQIQEAKSKLGIKYLRFHGIFNDELRVVTRKKDGTLHYIWDGVDKILDFLVGHQIAPFIDLTFMPDALKSSNLTIFSYHANMSKPNDINEWCDLIHTFISHCRFRYGKSEIEKWYFEIWNEPDMMWDGTWQDYLLFYKKTVETIRSVDRNLKIAGPSLMPPSKRNKNNVHLKTFIQYINQHDLPLDCFTFHLYGDDDVIYQDYKIIPLLGDEQQFNIGVDFYQSQFKKTGRKIPETIITEFGISAKHGNYLLDTMYPACRFIEETLKLHKKINGMAYWVLSDIFEENDLIQEPFHGGFGMTTKEGIHKPVWYAAWFLKNLGTDILAQSDHYIITKKDEDIQILVFCTASYDKLFIKGDSSLLKYDNRYEVFLHMNPIEIKINLKGLVGQYQLEEYQLNREHGSAYDIYVQMGMPKELTKEQIEYLAGLSRPAMTTCTIDLQGDYSSHVRIPVHGIYMALLKRYS